MSHHAFVLAGGIALVLLLASAVARVLKLKVAKGEPHDVIDNLTVRVNAWWALAALIGLALAAGRAGAVLFFACASALALREFVSAGVRDPGATRLWAASLPIVACQYALVLTGWHALYATFIPVCVVALPPVLRLVSSSAGRAARTYLPCGLLICVYCISYVPALLTLDITGYEGREAFLALFLLIVVQASDVLQYIWGKLFGRRRIAPALSPSKTLEGTLGGVLSATVLGAALAWITPFTPLEAASIAFVLALLGFAGGLLLSGVKRQRGIKDWGTLVKGHGGVLDRLDSVWLSAPAFFYIVSFGWA